ncbi:MAG: ATP-binding protein [Oscillospiraceae bacterium]|jgi:predicted AAA+ superfamily ATPase|nr:ATP-binding protein [Oscillospiraceae bacterium]
MSGLLSRPQYLEQLISFRDKQLIKVVTGIRRCGKSTLFDLYTDYLKEQGVEERQIIRLNLEYPEYHDLQTYMQLYDYIKAQLQDDCMNYVFIDEVQTVPEFQKAVDGLYVRKNCDVYITGSNAQILSGELATLLSGRYVEIKMLPLSFKEYIAALGEQTDLILKYRNYLENSSFPYALELSKKKDIRAYLGSIFDSVILKDIVARKKISDVATLQSITRFAFDNIGNLTSATSIANTLISGGRKISVHTVENYLEALTESFILYKAGRYDVKGKQQLVTGAKYYLSDIGLRYYLLGNKKADAGHILENIVYLELLRRGYEVHIGKVGNAEVDFIAIGEDGEEYYQVAYTVEGESGKDGKTVLERELAPLNAIKDHNPKFLLTMDFTPNASHNGIKQINALDWLLGE